MREGAALTDLLLDTPGGVVVVPTCTPSAALAGPPHRKAVSGPMVEPDTTQSGSGGCASPDEAQLIAVADHLMERIGEAGTLYHRLVFLAAPAGRGKTRVLQEVNRRTGAPLVNLNLELSHRMLDLTERRRVLSLPGLLAEIIDAFPSDVVLLDNTEMLFDVALKQDPLRLFQGLSRNKTIVAAWNGSVINRYLTYGVPEHHEYRRYPVHDYLVVSLDAGTNT